MNFRRITNEVAHLERAYDGQTTIYDVFNRHKDKTWEERADDALYIGEWCEVDEPAYTYFLDCMPPSAWTPDGYVMLEKTAGNAVSAFFKFRDDKRQMRYAFGMIDDSRRLTSFRDMERHVRAFINLKDEVASQ